MPHILGADGWRRPAGRRHVSVKALIRKEILLFSAISKTFDQLNDPAVRRVMAKTLGLAILGYVVFVILVYLLIGWLSGLSGWLEGLAQFGGVLAAMFIAWFIFPSVAAAIAGIFADEVIDAVEAKHYPGLPAAHPVPIVMAVADGLKLAGISPRRERVGAAAPGDPARLYPLHLGRERLAAGARVFRDGRVPAHGPGQRARFAPAS